MQERDAFKLQSVGCNQWSKQKIMADIYGCPSDALPQSEPADADDEDDFDVKLESLKNVWEKAAPAFHEWFRKTRSQQFRLPYHVSKTKSWYRRTPLHQRIRTEAQAKVSMRH